MPIDANDNSISERVRGFVAEAYGVDPEHITPTTRFVEDLDDSMQTVVLIMRLEEEFDIEIPDEDTHDLLCAQDVVNYLEGRLKSRTE